MSLSAQTVEAKSAGEMRWLAACPICDKSDLKELYPDAYDPHYGIPGRFRVVQCLNCSLVFVNPMLADELLMDLYPPDYYAYGDEPPARPAKLLLKRLFGYWQGVKDPRFDKPGTFLDLGCGAGAHVARMQQVGWRSYGVELNNSAVDSGTHKGLSIFRGTLRQAKFPSAYFDYIRASHSLEHMTCPHETLEEIRRILKPAGKIMIAVPNTASVTARLFGKYWWHLCPPVHPFGYSLRSLTELLSRHHFHVEKAAWNSDYVGLLGSLQMWINRDTGRRSFEGSLFASKPLRVLSGWMQRLFDVANRGDMIEVTAILKNDR